MSFLSIVRPRDIGLPLFGTADMDINYNLRREQVSLYNASMAASGPARLAHEGMASAYGKLLAEAGFPHRYPKDTYVGPVTTDENDRWMDDGGFDTASDPSSAKGSSATGKPVLPPPARPFRTKKRDR